MNVGLFLRNVWRSSLTHIGYDLPVNLNNQAREAVTDIQAPALHYDPNFITDLNTNMMLDEGQFADILETAEDWGFLNDFGDAVNNFYPPDIIPGN
jgi:hypothetical protein